MSIKKLKEEEKKLFRTLIKERGPFSQLTERELITDERNKSWIWQFEHILPKGSYPGYRLLPENIFLLTWEEHYIITHRPKKVQDDYADKYGVSWEEYRNKKAELMLRWHNENKVKKIT